ncbi:hypothetical protein [Sinorhizobium meliloti]|uniref:hypothetical protein n=1 Tax=Rhizobium meliloti TaxID=382 RepID=UPI000FD8E491|nr:hypothetical protein [Sinorhizobium meliloti]RVJ58243.1 hypothetical protein CN175_01925 [Sinorhizobium meliloti]
MADNYLRYGDTLSIINSYGGLQKGGYLGIGGRSTVPGAVSTVGAYKEGQLDNSTQWTILPPTSLSNSGGVVNSGDLISLRNNKDGNWLALFSSKPPTNSGYPVATTNIVDDRQEITPAWYILISTKNKANDPGLVDQDEIYLVATFGSHAGVLDTNGVGSGSFRYDVTGARLVNRDGGSGSWQVAKSPA